MAKPQLPESERWSLGAKVFWSLLVVGLVALASVAVIAIASGGYRPAQYAGGLDPIRLGIFTFLAASTAAFGLGAASQLPAIVRGTGGWPAILLPLSIAVMCATLLAILGSAPASGSFAVPNPLRVALYASLAILAAGLILGRRG